MAQPGQQDVPADEPQAPALRAHSKLRTEGCYQSALAWMARAVWNCVDTMPQLARGASLPRSLETLKSVRVCTEPRHRPQEWAEQNGVHLDSADHTASPVQPTQLGLAPVRNCQSAVLQVRSGSLTAVRCQ